MLRKRDQTEGIHRFCGTEDCDIVYFGSASQVLVADIDVAVFQKGSDPARPVCYCFGYNVAAIQANPASIVSDIKAKCKAGLDRCETQNPQGACCLGNVTAVAGRSVRSPVDSGSGCCDEAPGPPSQDGRSLPLLGAIIAALLSSACCWLPMLFLGTGASVAVVAQFLEGYRTYFVVLAAGLLGAGFYYSYFRNGSCAPSGSCRSTDPKAQRLQRSMLWLATLLVAAAALFPKYSALLASTPGPSRPSASALLPVRSFSISGMTCAGCAAQLEAALLAIDGVLSAEVSYPSGLAQVRATVPDQTLLGKIEEAGYRARARDAAP
jgi:copper chaperone CopZ